MKSKKEKPKYNVFQNFCFVTKMAWNIEKGCVLYPIVIEVAVLVLQLAELFITPMILSKIEQHAPLSELLWTIGIFTAVLLILAALQGYTNQISSRVDGRLRFYFFQLINKKSCITSYENTLNKDYQDLMAGVDHYVASIRLFGFSINFLGAVAGFVIYLFLLTTRLPMFLLAVTIATAVIGYLLDAKTHRWRLAHRKEVNGYAQRTYYVDNTIMSNEMGKDIRIFGLGAWLMDIFNSGFTLYMNYVKKRELRLLATNLVGVLMILLRNAMAYAYLIYLVLTEGLSASEFLLLFTAVSGFTQWVMTILEKVSGMKERSMELCQLREFLDYPEPFLFEEGAPVPTAKEYIITLENVIFQYPGAEAPTIDGLHLTLKPGEKIAIVGLNGAGKTTLVKLLCGFLDPTEGRVLLNGQDIREFNRREYYKLFTAVFQDFSGLNATIAANVAQTEDEIDYERVTDCLEKAGLTETVANLSEGVETYFGKAIYDDGIELSGGQTQRLMLARALYKNAPILVLDEPTAALDPLAESDIYQKYNAMSEGRSSIFISHRLASTQFCDRVLFLEKGQITEEGTHAQLLEKGAGYAKLFEVQARYYQEGEVEAWQE